MKIHRIDNSVPLSDIHILNWSACSPIENIRDIIVRLTYGESKTFENLELLRIADINAWTTIELLVLNNLILRIQILYRNGKIADY